MAKQVRQISVSLEYPLRNLCIPSTPLSAAEKILTILKIPTAGSGDFAFRASGSTHVAAVDFNPALITDTGEKIR
jgi:hypothetical protein